MTINKFIKTLVFSLNMGIFGKKKIKTIDFTRLSSSNTQQNNNQDVEREVVDLRNTSNSMESTAGTMDFLNTMASSSHSTSSTNPLIQVSEMSELRTNMRKLTGKIEDSENQVYRLMQRIELLEKKIERFENRGV